MPDLKRCFESAGFSEVLTVLGSGNVVFSVRTAPVEGLARRAEKAMHSELGRSFNTIIRPTQYLHDLIAAEPFAGFDLPATAKRVVTFLRQPTESSVTLPIERDGASILKLAAAEVFSAYVPNEKGPEFMNLLERTFGKDITTRTFETVQKCARA